MKRGQISPQETIGSHRATLSVRVGTSAIDGTYIGSIGGWRWMVGAIVAIVIVVAIATVWVVG